MSRSSGSESPENREETVAHLAACPNCARKSLELERMIHSLKEYETALCPEIWELHDFARAGHDPAGLIQRHLKDCCDCRETLAGLVASLQTQRPVPPRLMRSLEALTEKPPQRPGLFETLRELVLSTLKRPALGLATAAAAIMALVVLLPRDRAYENRPDTSTRQHGSERPSIITVPALSSVTWEATPGMELMAPVSQPSQGPKPKLATIMFFRNFLDHRDQKEIDSLYEALRPSRQMRGQHEFIPPSQVARLFSTGNLPTSRKDLLQDLRNRLHAREALIVTVGAHDKGFFVEAQVVDTDTGHTIGSATDGEIPQGQLPIRLRNCVSSALGDKQRDD